MIPRQFRIDEIIHETGPGEVYTWRLSPLDSQPLQFAPGQFNMLYQFGIGEVPISISGDANSSGLVHTLRAVGSVTKAMQGLDTGAIIGVRGPFGTAWPVAEAEGHDLVLVAGGIGLAPLRPALYYALRHRERFNRVFLLYGTRQPEDVLFSEELEHWRARLDLDIHVTVDRGGPDWHGNVGVVTKLIARGGFDPAQTIAMICGPEVMMRFSVMALQKHGVPANRIHVSMERNMQCAIGYCGHCQYGPHFVCKDGPVFRFDTLQPIFDVREL
jgi:NAD(P)H-flavin reductase